MKDLANGALDRIYADPLATQTHGVFVLLYGITQDDEIDVNGVGGAKIITSRSAADVRDAVIFQVLATGPEVRKEITDRIGDFCVAVSTALNPVAGLGNSRYALVHHDTIASTLDAYRVADLGILKRAEELRDSEQLAIVKALERAKANGMANV